MKEKFRYLLLSTITIALFVACGGSGNVPPPQKLDPSTKAFGKLSEKEKKDVLAAQIVDASRDTAASWPRRPGPTYSRGC